MLLIGSLGAMWAWWGKQFHEPKCGSGQICRVMAWTRHQGLVPYIDFEKVRGSFFSACRVLSALLANFQIGLEKLFFRGRWNHCSLPADWSVCSYRKDLMVAFPDRDIFLPQLTSYRVEHDRIVLSIKCPKLTWLPTGLFNYTQQTIEYF